MLKPIKLGLAGGILWALIIFIMTFLCLYTGYAKLPLVMISEIYLGMRISWTGALIGATYGLISGFAFFFLLAWLYSKL